MKQLYRGQADREAFAALPARLHCSGLLQRRCDYRDDLRALEAAFPGLSGIMVGRGLIGRPSPSAQGCERPCRFPEELRGYHDELYHGYTEAFGMASLCREPMKAHWFYLIHLFKGPTHWKSPCARPGKAGSMRDCGEPDLCLLAKIKAPPPPARQRTCVSAAQTFR